MEYNTYNIDLTLLKTYSNDLSVEGNDFNLVTHANFKNSYICNNENYFSKKIIANLEKSYKKIESDYKKINSFLDDYIKNTDSLEKSLINEVGGAVLESNIKNYIDSNLSNLLTNKRM